MAKSNLESRVRTPQEVRQNISSNSTVLDYLVSQTLNVAADHTLRETNTTYPFDEVRVQMRTAVKEIFDVVDVVNGGCSIAPSRRSFDLTQTTTAALNECLGRLLGPPPKLAPKNIIRLSANNALYHVQAEINEFDAPCLHLGRIEPLPNHDDDEKRECTDALRLLNPNQKTYRDHPVAVLWKDQTHPNDPAKKIAVPEMIPSHRVPHGSLLRVPGYKHPGYMQLGDIVRQIHRCLDNNSH